MPQGADANIHTWKGTSSFVHYQEPEVTCGSKCPRLAALEVLILSWVWCAVVCLYLPWRHGGHLHSSQNQLSESHFWWRLP